MRLLNKPNCKTYFNFYMKQAPSLSKKIFFIPICILICFVSCHPNAKHVQQKNIAKTFKSKLIVSFCAFNIVQIQDSAFYHHGTEWTNAQGVTYQHVFTVKNYCDFSTTNVKIDEIFNWYATSNELALQPGQGYFIASTDEEIMNRIKYEIYPLIREYLQEGLLRNAKEEFNNYFYNRISQSLFE